MRSIWFAVGFFVAGCFSESPSAGGCVEGDPACDCRPDGTCVADHECIASIDKCVPSGCTPGSESCTCVDGDCLSTFVCDGGVCVLPSAATTGGDPSVASSVDTGPGPTMTTSDPSDSDAMTMTTDDPTIPPADTSATDVSASASSDPSITDTSMSASDTSLPGCPACIELAGQDVCDEEYIACDTDLAADGCQQLMQCMLGGQEMPEACCEQGDGNADLSWNVLLGCAQGTTCADVCDLVCNPK